MSVWWLSKNGISLNQGGRWLTFTFIRAPKDHTRGKWLLHFFFSMFGAKIVVDKFFGTPQLDFFDYDN